MRLGQDRSSEGVTFICEFDVGITCGGVGRIVLIVVLRQAGVSAPAATLEGRGRAARHLRLHVHGGLLEEFCFELLVVVTGDQELFFGGLVFE